MATESPSLDDLFLVKNQVSSKGIDDLFLAKKAFEVGDGKTIVEPPKKAEIYAKGGDYDQFGPRPTQFDFSQAAMNFAKGGLLSPSANQPGSSLPMAGQMAGNVIGGFGGPVTAGIGGIAGALGGESLRQVIGEAKGVQDDTKIKQFENVAKTSAMAEGLGLGLYGGGKLIQKPLEKGAEKLMYNYLRPSKNLAQKNPDIAKDALRMGVKGSHSSALQQTEDYIASQMDELNRIINMHGDRETGLKNAFKYLDDSIADAKFAQSERAEPLMRLRQELEKEYLVPNMVDESRQFVLGAASKSVTPRKGNFSLAKMTRSQKDASGAVGGGRRVISPKTTLEEPYDSVSMRVTGKRGVTATPEEKYTIRRETKGPDITETKQRGVKRRLVTVGEAQSRKQAQYKDLKKRASDGKHGAEQMSPNIQGRQDYARGLKDDVVEALSDIPEVPKLNDEARRAMTVRDALFDRLPVDMRGDVLSLSDSVLGGMAFRDPYVLSLAAARKGLKTPGSASRIAQGMYGQSKKLALPYAERYGLRSRSPVVRALLAEAMRVN